MFYPQTVQLTAVGEGLWEFMEELCKGEELCKLLCYLIDGCGWTENFRESAGFNLDFVVRLF